MTRPDGTAVMVLIPTYMEAGSICRLLAQLREQLPAARILVVDDRSPDGTAALVRARYAADPGIEVVSRTGPRAYAAAMAEGMRHFLASDAAWLITIDADLSHDPALAARMLERAGGGGVVIGSRYLRGVPRAAWALARMQISILGNWYVRWLTGLPAADCTSGFRCYARGAVECIDPARLRARGFAFQVEALHMVWRAGLPIAEVPIRYRDRLAGSSKLSLAILGESLWLPWRLRRRRPRPRPAGRGAPAAARAPGSP